MSFSNLIKTGLLTTTLSVLFLDVSAQNVFERRAVEVSNLGISFTNVGTIGRPNVRNLF